MIAAEPIASPACADAPHVSDWGGTRRRERLHRALRPASPTPTEETSA